MEQGKHGLSKLFKQMKKALIWVSEKSRWIWEAISKHFFDKRGKPKVGYNTNKLMMVSIAFVFVLSMFAYSVFTDKVSNFASLTKYEEQMAETDGMKGRKITKDPNSLNTSVSEKVGTMYGAQSGSLPVNSSTGTAGQTFTRSLTKEDCLSLIERAAKNEELSLAQKDELSTCITENPMGWDEDKLANARILTGPNSPPEAKKLAQDAILGKGPNVLDGIKPELETSGISLPDISGPDLKNLFDKNGKPKKGAVAKLVEEKKKQDEAVNSSSIPTLPNIGDLRDLGDKIDQNNRDARKVKEEKDRIQKNLKENDTKNNLANGGELSPEEVANLARLNELNEQMKNLEKERAALLERFGVIKAQIDDLSTDANLMNEEISENGYLITRTVKTDKRGSGVASIEEVPLNGSSTLNPIDVLSKNDKKLKRAALRRQELDDKVKLTVAAGWVTNGLETGSLQIAKTKRIAGIMEKFEYCTDANGLRIRAVILESIIDSRTGLIAIPKKSVLVGQAGSFSVETGRMNIIFNEVWMGQKSMKVNFTVGSGDGTVGLAGDIYDTRGRKLIATWIGAFTSGVMSWFSEAVLREYEDTKNMTTALIGATMNGLKDVAEKQTQTMMSDLNNAPVCFRLPAHTPIVLFP
ncbi:TrbI/VirB10 family protein [Bdellovibrio sp. BCCA]|uniref:TrbI/VirB10 family protein n=1 Tax=Bdellovibrio sp. BCCA TaxID=3136281 RepID=UPI0030F2F06D